MSDEEKKEEEEKKVKMYFVIDGPVINRLKLDMSGDVLKEVPWAVSRETKTAEAIKVIEASPFKGVLVVDPDGKEPTFAVTDDQPTALKCKGKGRGRMIRHCAGHMIRCGCSSVSCTMIYGEDGKVVACSMSCGGGGGGIDNGRPPIADRIGPMGGGGGEEVPFP